MASSPDEFLDARSNFTPNNDINNTRGTPDTKNQTPPTGRQNHFMALGIVVAYDMYREVVSEANNVFDVSDEESKRWLMDFHQFREQLTRRGLFYHDYLVQESHLW